MRTDILRLKQINLLFTTSKMIIYSCDDLIVLISTTACATQQVKRLVQTKRKMIIESHMLVKILIQLWEFTDLLNRILMFQSEYHNITQWLVKGDEAIYAYVVDSSIAFVQIWNDSDELILLEHHTHLSYITECLEENCYLMLSEAHSLTDKVFTKIHWSSWVWRALTAVSLVSDIVQSAFSESLLVSNFSQPFSKADASVVSAVNVFLEIILSNSITVYGKLKVSALYAETVNQYSDLWVDKSWVIKLLKKDWMTISLIDDWDPSKVTAKIYSTTEKDCDEIDKAFNKLHKQNWMKFFNELISFAYPVFVVWCTIAKEDSSTVCKARVVVNIHSLNKIILPDSYLLLQQSDIISAVRDCFYILTMNEVIFFYQWLMFQKDCHKLTVTTHQNLKHFNVAVMRFWNFFSYVQRQIDCILWSYYAYTQIYINDIVVFSKTLKKHISYLNAVFELLNSLDIVLVPAKTFLSFSFIILLSQKVNSLSMTAADEKIIIISKLAFLITLQDLEHYLGLTEWLCDYISYYAQIVEPLQARKTEMLQNMIRSESAEKKRKIAAHSTKLVKLTDIEIAVFACLQEILSKKDFLHHFDLLRQLYIDLNLSKWGIEVIVYHIKRDSDSLKVTDICKSDI